MEFLEKIGDWFVSFTGGVERFITRLFGSSNEKRVKKIGFVREKKSGESSIVPGSVLERINQLEPQFEKLTDDELKQTAGKFRERIAKGETLDHILPEAFAAVRESSKRYLKMRHYDVQMVGGYILHQGMIAEMVTGEGKTLVGTLPAFLNALTGKVHLVTVNDYLALRDMEWMGPVHMGLGLKVGAIQSSMSPWERHPHYACDITYGTNNEFGFDYLRDNMKRSRQEQAQGPLDFAIVDEIDNILIDEARTPLIISGSAHDDVTKYPKANKIALQLKRDVDFEVKEKEHTCHLTEEGIRRAEELAGVESFYTVGNMEWPHLIDNALKAHYLYKRDHQYMVRNGEVIIVDEHTGRAMEGRQWSDGLHQAVESKEGVKVKEETQTYATITLQNFFKLYKKLAGMTGTAMTEAPEFLKIYNLDVVAVPTNRPLKRVNFPDLVYCTEREKWDAVVKEVVEVHKTGRPILVGTVSIEKSEYLSGRLDRNGIKHNVLNAKHVEREAELIAQAGRLGAVTIATNMAGRGTDIILGGNPENAAWEQLKRTYRSRLDVPKAEWDSVTKQIAESEGMKEEGRQVEGLGGLHVVGTERHDSRRIDLQLRGRAGRQGDHGSSRFFVSLEDDLMRLFGGDRVKGLLRTLGMAEGEAIESPMVTRRIEAAQKKREETHFDQRKNLLEYDEVMDDQRKRVYGYRQQILDGANCRDRIMEMIEKQVRQATEVFLARDYRWESIASWSRQEQMVDIDVSTIRDMEKDQLVQYIKDEMLTQADELLQEKLDETLPQEIDPKDWNWQALSQWFNHHYTENTNAGELKKQGRDDLHTYLYNRAKEAIERKELKTLDIFLQPDYQLRALCGWVGQQFSLDLKPEELQADSPEQAADLLMDKLTTLYREKEISFPVAVGVNQYMSRQMNDKENLINWANLRFQSHLDAENVKNKQRKEIEQLLHDASQKYFVNGDVTGKVDEYLNEAYHDGNGHSADRNNPQATAALGQLAHWANQEFHSKLEPSDFETLTRTEAREKVITEYESRYRPELARAERAVILEFLDTAWKEHLYYMDHLRSGIGLVGYAQKDAKVEYKREGKKAFEMMWDRIEQNVTSSIFRLEQDSPDYVGHLWDASSATKSAPPPDMNTISPDAGTANTSSGGENQVVDPIRNYGEKVGRNDLCPCGSGKKFKKCHGA